MPDKLETRFYYRLLEAEDLFLLQRSGERLPWPGFFGAISEPTGSCLRESQRSAPGARFSEPAFGWTELLGRSLSSGWVPAGLITVCRIVISPRACNWLRCSLPLLRGSRKCF